MTVSACIATRGDVDMRPILASLPDEWEKIVWDNRKGVYVNGECVQPIPNDLGPYGRFEGIQQYASNDICYVQDDDVLVSDPQGIVDEWELRRKFDDPDSVFRKPLPHEQQEHLVANMPKEFRPYYTDSAMVGFGAAFYREAPKRAFIRYGVMDESGELSVEGRGSMDAIEHTRMFLRESCRIFTTLTPIILVDIPKKNMPYALAPNRLWKQPDHIRFRDTALDLAREARDARAEG